MKRLLCGSVVLAASLGLVSCNGDPTSDFRSGPSQILAAPSTVFIDQGDVEPVNVRVVDDAGDPLAATWEIAETGPGITVERNPDFLPTTVGAPLESEVQFIVTAGGAPTASSFTVTAEDLSLEIPVNVLPTEIATAAFSNPTPAVNEVVTITAEGYTFRSDAAVSFEGDTVLMLSNDGTSISFLPFPGTTGPALVEKVTLNFLPETPLDLFTAAEIAVAPLTPLAGTDAPGTAPSIPVPEPGATTTFFDGGTYDYPAPIFGGAFGTFPSRLYRISIPEAGDYTVNIDWEGGVEDLGVYYFLPDGTTEPPEGIAADAGGAGAHPEESTSTLNAGDYLLAVVNFSTTNPPSITLRLTRAP
jgi:hypothetical protein